MPESFRGMWADRTRVARAWIYFTIVLAIVCGGTLGLSVALLALAGGALALVIGLLWSSLHSLSDESVLSLEEALSMALPSAEEEQKRSVLRALKDLEFEKSLGKISDEDYRTLSASYRQQAKNLIRVLDTGLDPLRAQVEALVAERLGQAKSEKRQKKRPKRTVPAAPASIKAAASEPVPAQPALDDDGPTDGIEPELGASHEADVTCAECNTRNDTDAKFCKRCGKTLSAPEQA